MQILIILASIVVILIVFGFPVLPILIGIFVFLEGVALLSTFFFFIMGCLALLARPRKAVFIELTEEEHGAMFANYDMGDETVRNLFPTDGFLAKWLYSKKEVKVRVLQFRKRKVVFDRLTQVIIAIGFPAFLLLSALLLLFVTGM